jgi:signal transduction histidine kinase
MALIIIDDEPYICKLLENILHDIPEESMSFTSPYEAFDYLSGLSDDSYNVLLLDYYMPGMNGHELIRKIMAHDRKYYTYIIVMTGTVDQDRKHIDSLYAGADDFVRKPFDASVIKARISTGLRSLELKKSVALYTRKLEQKNRELESSYAQLAAAQSKMVQQEKLASIGELSAGISHEINNPVGFIKSNTESLGKYVRKISGMKEKICAAETLLPKEQKDLAFIIEDMSAIIQENGEGIARIESIVNHMKKFARHDRERERELCNINDAVRSTLVIARNRIKYIAEIDLELKDVPDIYAVSSEINQVLLNIIVNAVQAIEEHCGTEKGRIGIRTCAGENTVQCEISDNGAGIDQIHQARIFDLFFTTKTKLNGSGLGLSISHDIIVNKHGGELSFQSRKGRGTTFLITLPVKQEDGL